MAALPGPPRGRSALCFRKVRLEQQLEEPALKNKAGHLEVPKFTSEGVRVGVYFVCPGSISGIRGPGFPSRLVSVELLHSGL